MEPCQPIGAAKPPSGAGWLHEIKHDGRGVGGRLLTRNGNDWTERYPSVVATLYALKVKSCLIDGEITVCDENGLAVFDLLRHGSRIKPEGCCSRSTYLSLMAKTCGPCRSRHANASWPSSCAMSAPACT
jgi:ATP-dependent DNA ligase